jgi:hypothetical protein
MFELIDCGVIVGEIGGGRNNMRNFSEILDMAGFLVKMEELATMASNILAQLRDIITPSGIKTPGTLTFRTYSKVKAVLGMIVKTRPSNSD